REGEQPAGRMSDGTHFRSASLLKNPKAFDLVDALQGIAQEKSCTLSQLAVAWCMQRPGITSPIIGPRTLAQLEDHLGALSLSLSKEELERIDAISPPGAHAVPFYEAAFGPHEHRV